MESDPNLRPMTQEERRAVERCWKRFRNTVHGALVNQIHCHGAITTGHLPSAMKRVIGQLHDPLNEFILTILEMRD